MAAHYLIQKTRIRPFVYLNVFFLVWHMMTLPAAYTWPTFKIYHSITEHNLLRTAEMPLRALSIGSRTSSFSEPHRGHILPRPLCGFRKLMRFVLFGNNLLLHVLSPGRLAFLGSFIAPKFCGQCCCAIYSMIYVFAGKIDLVSSANHQPPPLVFVYKGLFLPLTSSAASCGFCA